MAHSIFRYTRKRLAPFKRVRLIKFVPDLPNTISGKIRRVQLRRCEYANTKPRAISRHAGRRSLNAISPMRRHRREQRMQSSGHDKTEGVKGDRKVLGFSARIIVETQERPPVPTENFIRVACRRGSGNLLRDDR
jgi:hypothetical protein